MNFFDLISAGYFYYRRAEVLSGMMAHLIPENSRVLDIGCGDGFISKCILDEREDIRIEGIDVLLRPTRHIPVIQFDGAHLPYDDASFDATMFIDVLHHTNDPGLMLREAARVSKNLILLKDHTLKGFLAKQTLLYLDWVGNVQHGVPIPATYWSEKRWQDNFDRLNLEVKYWTDDVPLNPWWSSWLFDRSLQFVACLAKPSG